MDFTFYMPTRVFVGKDCVKKNSGLFSLYGKRALVVSGANSAKRNGSLDDLDEALHAGKVSYRVYDGVAPNPTVDCVYEGAEIARESGAEFIIAIGGGSPMDAAKAIALLAAQKIDREDIFKGPYGSPVLPLVFIPTTAGTGSEVTPYSILTNENEQTKMSISGDSFFPQTAFLDATYTLDLSVDITIATALDAFSHSVEGMLTKRANIVSDALAKESIALIIDALGALCQIKESGENASFELREKLLCASLLAGMVIAQTGTTVVHSLGYSLTFFNNIAHGRANGLLLASYLRLVAEKRSDLREKILRAADLSTIGELERLLNALLGERETISSDALSVYTNKALLSRNLQNSAVAPSGDELRLVLERSLNVIM